ncbi:MAG: hypothetical protein AAF587_30265 [Bacteroidota bacterium]
MVQIIDFFKRYTASPGTGIILLNLGILIIFFYPIELYPWAPVVSHGLMIFSAIASLMYLVQKTDLGPKEGPASDEIRFEDKGTAFLKFYQYGLPVLILVLCGFILYLFRKTVVKDFYISGALVMAILVQLKILYTDLVRSPFVLRITDSCLSMNLKGYEEVHWEEVDQIDWNTQEITFTLLDELEHSVGFGKMLENKRDFLKAVQHQAVLHQINIVGEEEVEKIAG